MGSPAAVYNGTITVSIVRYRYGGRAIPVAAEQAAHAFLHLVVGGPGSMSTWGAVFDKKTLEQRTRYAVKLFLHGTLRPD
jgi:hypothetical protein